MNSILRTNENRDRMQIAMLRMVENHSL